VPDGWGHHGAHDARGPLRGIGQPGRERRTTQLRGRHRAVFIWRTHRPRTPLHQMIALADRVNARAGRVATRAQRIISDSFSEPPPSAVSGVRHFRSPFFRPRRSCAPDQYMVASKAAHAGGSAGARGHAPVHWRAATDDAHLKGKRPGPARHQALFRRGSTGGLSRSGAFSKHGMLIGADLRLPSIRPQAPNGLRRWPGGDRRNSKAWPACLAVGPGDGRNPRAAKPSTWKRRKPDRSGRHD